MFLSLVFLESLLDEIVKEVCPQAKRRFSFCAEKEASLVSVVVQ
jgi:hypothetical protein